MDEEMFLGKDAWLNPKDLNTHVFICGSTGSGKTVMAKILIEEALLRGIPVIAVDLKGDVSSLAFPIELFNEEGFRRFKFIDYEEHLKKLEEFGYTYENIEALKDGLTVKILSPFGITGIPLSFSPIPPIPEDEEDFHEAKTLAASNLVYLLGKANKDMGVELAYLQALIEYHWRNGTDLSGLDGLKLLISSIVNPPIEKIGVRSVDDFISPKVREKLANALNAKLVTYERLLRGYNISDIDGLIDNDKTLVIVDLSNISDFALQSQIVSIIAHSIYVWMKKKGESERPRLIFFVDEIGGGGGGTSMLPPDPYITPSKIPLRLLLKQARAFGVGTLIATQNPGDVDYRSLSNCLTWFVGRLGRKRDREKVLENVASNFETEEEDLSDRIANLEPGEFIMITKGEIKAFKQRWLLTPHKTLSKSEKKEIFEMIYGGEATEEAPEEYTEDEAMVYDSEMEEQVPVEQISEEIETEEEVEMEERGIDELKDDALEIVDEIASMIEKELNDVDSMEEERMKRIREKFRKVEEKMSALEKVNFNEETEYLSNLSKWELLATLEGSYERKKMFKKEVYEAKKLSRLFERKNTIFKEGISEIEDILKEIMEDESLPDIEKRFLISLKYLEEKLDKKLRKEEILQIIFRNTIDVFRETLDDLKHKISTLQRKVSESHESFQKEINRRRSLLRGYVNDIHNSLMKLTDLLKDMPTP